jgi:hypothetical protein
MNTEGLKQDPLRFHREVHIDLFIKQFDIYKKHIVAFVFSYIWYMFPPENNWDHGI